MARSACYQRGLVNQLKRRNVAMGLLSMLWLDDPGLIILSGAAFEIVTETSLCSKLTQLTCRRDQITSVLWEVQWLPFPIQIAGNDL